MEENKLTVLDLIRELITRAKQHENWPEDNSATDKLIKIGSEFTVQVPNLLINGLFAGLASIVDMKLLIPSHDLIDVGSSDLLFCADRAGDEIHGAVVGKEYYGFIENKPINYDPSKHEGILWLDRDIHIFYYMPIDLNQEQFLELFVAHNIIKLSSNSNEVNIFATVGAWSNTALNHLASMYLREKGCPIINM